MSTAAGSSPDATRRLQILVVDDQKDTARMLQIFIGGAGHAVQIAGTKAAALELAGQVAFDVVVSDLRLPDGSGNELMQELRARHGVKGIAFTGLSGQEEEANSRAAGFSALLVKPQGLDRLLETIDRVASEK